MNKILIILKEIIHEIVQFKQPVLIILQYFNSTYNNYFNQKKNNQKDSVTTLQYYINSLSISSPYRL